MTADLYGDYCAVQDCDDPTDGGNLCPTHIESHEVCCVCDHALEISEMYVPGDDGDEEPDQPYCRSCATDEGFYQTGGFAE